MFHVRLHSEFTDFYDPWFDKKGKCWHRSGIPCGKKTEKYNLAKLGFDPAPPLILPSACYRVIHIGCVEFWLLSSNENSRQQDKPTLLSGPVRSIARHAACEWPLWEVVFLEDELGYRHATEFKLCPVLYGTGIEKVCTGPEVVGWIKRHLGEAKAQAEDFPPGVDKPPGMV